MTKPVYTLDDFTLVKRNRNANAYLLSRSQQKAYYINHFDSHGVSEMNLEDWEALPDLSKEEYEHACQTRSHIIAQRLEQIEQNRTREEMASEKGKNEALLASKTPSKPNI